jgi:Cyclic nucleotide-binding domain
MSIKASADNIHRGSAYNANSSHSNSNRLVGKFANSSGTNGKILSSAYHEKKKKLEDFSRMLQDSCDQIIRRFVADALKYKPDDILDFSSRWVARERGITLEEVEKEIFQQVIDMGLQPSQDEEENGEEEDDHSDIDIQDDLNRGRANEGEENTEGYVQNYEIETERSELNFDVLQISDENGEEAEAEYKGADLKVRIARRVNMSFALKHLSVEDRTKVILAVKEVEVVGGSRIIQQGEPGTDYYLLEEGKFRCLRKYEGDDEEMELKEYLPGDCFGE